MRRNWVPQTKLAMLCPTKNRPDAVARMGNAWEGTYGEIDAELIWVVDADDDKLSEYQHEIAQFSWMRAVSIPHWMPMVPKLNWAARELASDYPMLGFMGDDHLPRSRFWTRRLAAELDAMKTGIVYGRDGFQDAEVPTYWAMTSNIVVALNAMVPVRNLQHLYCDNAVKVLGEYAGCLRFLSDVLVEHMHPLAGKSKWDSGHRRVNRPEQYDRDQVAFRAWIADGMTADVSLVQSLREV